jgi:hypothetical protein
MELEVRIGRRDAALVVSKRLPVRLSEIGGVIGRAFGAEADQDDPGVPRHRGGDAGNATS